MDPEEVTKDKVRYNGERYDNEYGFWTFSKNCGRKSRKIYT